jgi:5-methylcytosine-specific restriction endonuclease McrA
MRCGLRYEIMKASRAEIASTRQPAKKPGNKWQKVRLRWFAEHKADDYACYICEVFLPRNETTLDHVQPRGSHPKLKHELTNLEPACMACQGGKGSKSLAYYIAERDKYGLHVTKYARDLAARIEAITRKDGDG